MILLIDSLVLFPGRREDDYDCDERERSGRRTVRISSIGIGELCELDDTVLALLFVRDSLGSKRDPKSSRALFNIL